MSALSPVLVDEPIPAVCGVQDVARILRISVNRVHALRRQHKLDAILLPTLVADGKARYSGAKLRAWVNGDLERPRYFGGVRRRSG